jgi:hypothetical protein
MPLMGRSRAKVSSLIPRAYMKKDRRRLRKARRLKDAKRLERELKQAQINHAYAQHWAMLT